MTFREKHQKEHPNCNIECAIEDYCPKDFKYEETFNCIQSRISCTECWNREIPE